MKNRKMIWLLTATLILQSIPMNPITAFAATDKANEQEYGEDAIYLSTAAELSALAGMSTGEDATVDKLYVLKNDIDLTGIEYMPIPVFAGTLDGNGHKISGLTITEEGTDMGLIRFVGTKGVVQNLFVEADIRPGGNRTTVGGIAGTNKGTIINCTFSGNMVARKQVGGIAGVNEKTGVIISCRNTATLLGTKRVGGIVGDNQGKVQQCSNLGEINHTSMTVPKDDENGNTESSLASLMEDEDKIESIGGIAGISTGIITKCENKSTISYKHTGYQVGGIVGYQNGCVEQCINSGLIYGRKDVGGIVGLFEPYIEIDYDEDTFSSLETEMDALSDMLDSLSDATRNAGDLLQEDADAISNTTDELREKLDYYKDYYKDSNKDFDSEVSSQMDEIREQIEELDFSVNLGTIKKNYDQLQKEIDNITEILKSSASMSDSDRDRYSEMLDNAKDTADSLKDYIDSAATSGASDNRDDWQSDEDSEDEEDGEDGEDDEDDGDEDDRNRDGADEDSRDNQDRDDATDKHESDKDEREDDDSKSDEKEDDEPEEQNDEEEDNGGNEEAGMDRNTVFRRDYQLWNQQFEWIPAANDGQYDVIMIDTDDDVDTDGDDTDEDSSDDSSEVNMEIVSELQKSLANISAISNDVSNSVSNKVKKAQGLQDDLDDLGDSVDDLYDYVSDKKDKLRDDISTTSDDLGASNDALADGFDSLKDDFKNSKNDVRNQMDQVKDQMSSIRGTVKNGVERVRNRLESGDFYYDISEKTKPEAGNGRLLACLNQAEVNSDINGGGVIGRISIELGNTINDTTRGKFQINESGERSLHFDRNVCAAVYGCQNDSDIMVKNDYAGGIVGRADYGAVMGCQNYGNITVEDGDYAGGIAGKSDNLVKNSYSLCDVEAEEYAGGVVGFGTVVIGNTAMSTATGKTGSKAGTIAGDVDTDGEVMANLFVDEGQGAVNGVTYIEEATAVKYERLIRDENTPDRFRVFQIRYLAGNKQLKKLEVAYGGAVKETDIPSIPEKEGCYSYWEEKQTEFVTRNITVHAQYEAWQNSVGSVSTGQDKATMLAQADFYPGTELLCTPIEVDASEVPKGYKLQAAYHYQLQMKKDKDIEEIIYRVLIESASGNIAVAVRTEEGYKIVDTHKVDSYIQFIGGEKENDILILQNTESSVYLCVGLFIMLLVAAGGTFAIKHRKKK